MDWLNDYTAIIIIVAIIAVADIINTWITRRKK